MNKINLIKILNSLIIKDRQTKIKEILIQLKTEVILIEENEKKKKALKWTEGLTKFVDRTLGRAFDAFKNEYDIGQASKKRAVIQLINATKGGQKRFYDRWLESLKDYRVLKQTIALKALFRHSTSSFSKSFLPILRLGIKPSYTLSQIEHIQSYLTKVVSIREHNFKKAFEILYLNYYKTKKNPWYKKSALILALNTRVNTQKSFWRLKHNIYSTGVIYNAAIIVKLKKLFNNLRKYYELNMYKIFLTIDKYGRNLQEAEMTRVRQSRMTNQRQTTRIKTTERFQSHHEQHQQQEIFFSQQEQHVALSEA
jgi:hypothetical protein